MGAATIRETRGNWTIEVFDGADGVCVDLTYRDGTSTTLGCAENTGAAERDDGTEVYVPESVIRRAQAIEARLLRAGER
jgi:hypothetical protein